MSNQIHPTAIIGENVNIGDGNTIGPYSVLYGPLQIGDNNWIGPHVTIGTPGQDTRNPHYDSRNAQIVIGSNNIIREYTAIQKPCYRDVTFIGNNVFLMQSVHIPHDAVIEDYAVITPMVAMAGIVRVMYGANLALGCTVHQYSVIGPYSIAAMGSTILKNIKPFSRHVPGKNVSINTYAIEKFGFSEHTDEISNYVINDIRPISNSISEIIQTFEKYSLESARGVYGR